MVEWWEEVEDLLHEERHEVAARQELHDQVQPLLVLEQIVRCASREQPVKIQHSFCKDHFLCEVLYGTAQNSSSLNAI